MEISLQKLIKRDQTQARKAQDKILAGTLGTLFTEIQKVGKDAGNRETTDKEAQLVIAKFLKDLRTTFKLYTGMELNEFKYVTGKDQDQKMQKAILMYSEAKIYESYLPTPLTQDEIKIQINNLIAKDKGDIGSIMNHFKEKYFGLYDGKEVSKLARELQS